MTNDIPAAESVAAPLLDQPVAKLLPGCPAGTSHGARVGDPHFDLSVLTAWDEQLALGLISVEDYAAKVRTLAKPAAPVVEALCEACGEQPAYDDGDVPRFNARLCNQCATEIAYDLAELKREDHRVGLCCSNNCGGYCPGGSH